MSKKGFLITECNHDLQINEGKDKNLYVTGIFSSFGDRNNNGRVYEEGTLKREVEKIIEKVEKKSLWGELGHPPNPEINPDKIAIRVESLEWDGKDLYGKAKILNTPQGQIARELVKEGMIGISSRGLGTVSEDGTVNEDYQLLTWDLVTDPSNGPSWVNGIFEGKTWELGDKFSGEQVDEEVKEDTLTESQAKEEFFKHIMESLKEIEKTL
jgi:hypothetical protein